MKGDFFAGWHDQRMAGGHPMFSFLSNFWNGGGSLGDAMGQPAFAGKGNPMSDGGLAQPLPFGGKGNPMSDGGLAQPTLGAAMSNRDARINGMGRVAMNNQEMSQPFQQRGSSYSFY